jgi:hypothetical protein
MYASEAKKTELIKKISLIPEQKLEEVSDFIDFIIVRSGKILSESGTLEGIWKDKGFEKIQDLEAEIIEVRKEIGDAILRRRV